MEETKTDSIYAESCYLRELILSSKNTHSSSSGISARVIELKSVHHVCNPSACNFINLPAGREFIYHKKKWVAIGCVYVCDKMAKTHVCDDYCNEYVILPRGEGSACTVRGVHLRQEFSLARSHLDPDIRVVGNDSYVPHPFYEGDCEQSREEHQEGIDYDDEQKTDKDSDLVEFDSGACSYGETVYETLFKLARNNDTDVQAVMSRYHGCSKAVLEEKVVQRAEWRQCAMCVWNTHLMSEEYRRMLSAKADADTQAWRKDLLDYAMKCREQGIEPDVAEGMYLWIKYVHPSYQGIYVGGDIETTTNAHSAYYVECMLRLWERYSDISLVKENRITFNMCCTALLNSLSTGLTIYVCLIDDNPKPRELSNLTEAEQKRARMIEVEMIRAHSTLKLVPPELIRASNTKQRTGRLAKSAQFKPIGGKLAFTNRQRLDTSTKKRTKNTHSCYIPPQKHLRIIVKAIVDESPTLADLLSYSFSNVVV